MNNIKLFLIMSNKKGEIIARPNLVIEDKKWFETINTENLLESSNIELRNITNNMINGKTGYQFCKLEVLII